MTINYPTSLDNFTNPTSSSPTNSPSHADQHANANDAIEALEAKVGVDGSSVVTSHDYKIAQLQSLVTSAVAGAKSIYQDVRNQSGSAFTKATPVYVSGSTGASGQLLVSAASNATEATSSKTMGITTSAISNNSNGQVISEGILEGIDTTGAADGDPVWLGVNGAKIYGLANKPSAPAHLVFLGVVIRGGQANTGSMYVKIQNGFELQEIHNVEISSLINGNILAYDSTTQTWKNTNTIQSTSSTVPLAVKASESQTANLQEWQDSTGTVKASIRSSGGLSLNYANSIRLYNTANTDYAQLWMDNGSGGSNLYVKTNYSVLMGNVGVDTGASLTVATQSTGQVGQVIRGVASQSADLQQWQNSSGTTIVRFDAYGSMYAFNNAVYGNAYGDVLGRATYYTAPATIGIVIRGASGQTANLQEWQNSSGAVVARITAAGSLFSNATINSGTTSSNLGQITSIPVTVGTVGLVIRGLASQTANLQQWQNSAGTTLAYVSSTGFINTAAGIGTNTTSYMNGIDDVTATKMSLRFNSTSYGLQLTNIQAGAVGYIVKGAASQTANLTEWQDSSGTVLTKVDSSGNIGIGAGTTSLNYGLDIFTGSMRVWNGVTGAGQTGTIYLGDGSFSKTYGSGWTFNGGITTNNEIYITGGTLHLGDGYLTKTSGNPFIINSGFWVNGSALTIGGSNINYNNSFTVYAGSSTRVGAVIQGAASQTANLQEWQDSAGTVLTKVDSTGQITSTNGTQFGTMGPAGFQSGGSSGIVDIHYNGGNLTIRSGSAYSSNTSLLVGTGYAGGIGQIIKGSASQTADLQQWQDSSGTVLAYVDNVGKVTINALTVNPSNAGNVGVSYGIGALEVKRTAFFDTGNASNVGIIVRGRASQSVNLQEWQNSSGTADTSINSTGRLSVRTTLADAALNVGAPSAATVNAIIRGAASQTANLQEWQDSSGNVLTAVASNGTIRITNISSNSNTGAYTNYASDSVTIIQRVTTSSNLIIRAAVSQTADLQQWQNSAGTVLANIASDGALRINKIRASNGTADRVDFAGGTDWAVTIPNNISTTSVNLIIKAAPSQTANLQEWQDSAGTVLSKIKSTGALEISASDSTRALYVSNSNASGYGMIVNANGGRIFQAQVNGTTKFFVDGTGLFRIGLGASAPSGVFHIDMASAGNGSASNLGLTIRSNTSQTQTGDLFQIQDASSNAIFAITPGGAIKGGNSNTISVNTASTVDTVALSSFTSIEYTLSIKQGSKIRSSKVLVHTDGTSVDSTEYGIMEMGGGITGILVTASVSGTDAILQVTITDAATTNATVKLIKTML